MGFVELYDFECRSFFTIVRYINQCFTNLLTYYIGKGWQ